MTPEVRFILDRALTVVDSLRAVDRAKLYEGVAQIADGDLKEEAKKMAFSNRALAKQERALATQQTEFLAQLFA